MRICWVAMGVLMALAAAEPGIAAQCASVGFSPSNVSLPNYDPIAGSAVQGNFTATITRTDPSTTAVRMIFMDSDDSASMPLRLGVVGTTPGPRYDILDGSGAKVAFPLNTDVTTKRSVKVSLPAGSSGDLVSANYRVDVLANTVGKDFQNGTYGEPLTYSIQCFQGTTSQSTDTQVTAPTLSMVIPNLVTLTTGGPQTLDFQNFTSLAQQLNVGVKSTGPINIDLRTANQRKMILAGAPAPAPLNSYIAYSINLNGRSVTQDPYIVLNAPRTGVAGKAWPLKLSLPSQPSGKIAGAYNDTITLTVTPGN